MARVLMFSSGTYDSGTEYMLLNPTSEIVSHSDNNLYGFVFMGHGTYNITTRSTIADGAFSIHTYGSPLFGRSDNVSSEQMQQIYKFGLAVVGLCHASSANWHALASNNGAVYVQPYSLTWPWRVPEILFNAVKTVWEVK